MLITLLSFNIHKGVGWHRFHATFEEIDERIRELAPDLIFFQEILGKQVEYAVFDLWQQYNKNVVYPTITSGNAIFSKFKILFSENFDLSTFKFDKRGLLHSIIELPQQQRLHLLCVHLGLFKKSRQLQYEKIVNYIRFIIGKDEPIILAGDFNDWGSHATIPLVKEMGLNEAFMLKHHDYAKTFPAWRPLLKLDRVYSRGIKVVSSERMMHKAWRKLSDHIALKVVFEIT